MKEFKQYLRILGYLKPYKWLVLVTIASSLLVAGSFGGAIGAIKPLIELLTGTFDPGTYSDLPLMDTRIGVLLLESLESLLVHDKSKILVIAALVYVTLITVRAIFKFIHGYVGSYLAQRLQMDISIELHDKIMNQSISFFSDEGVGDTISVITYDTSMLQRGAKLLFDKILLEPLNVAVALGLAFWLNPKLAALAVIGFPLIGYSVNRFGRQIKKSIRKTLKNRASILSLLQESLFGIKIIKSFVMEDYERGRFLAENKRLLKNSMRAVRARELLSPVVEIVAAVGGGLFLLVGGRSVLSGEMSEAAFLQFNVALAAVIGPLRKLSKAVGEVQTSLAGAVRTFGFMDRLPGVEDSPDAVEMPPIKGKVEFDNIRFSYDGRDTVIRDITLAVEPGEVVALVGLSGAGKTTLINLLLRFYDVGEGSILVDGTDIRQIDPVDLRRNVGYVPQDLFLFRGTVRDNITIAAPYADDADMLKASQLAGIDGFISQHPKGYDLPVGERGDGLSGGQRQSIAVARALLRQPNILIMDEPTSSMDTRSEDVIKKQLPEVIG